MANRISHISIDEADSYAQSLFWSELLVCREDLGDPNPPEHDERMVMALDRT